MLSSDEHKNHFLILAHPEEFQNILIRLDRVGKGVDVNLIEVVYEICVVISVFYGLVVFIVAVQVILHVSEKLHPKGFEDILRRLDRFGKFVDVKIIDFFYHFYVFFSNVAFIIGMVPISNTKLTFDMSFWACRIP